MRNKYTFCFDDTQPTWKNAVELSKRSGQVCYAEVEGVGVLDIVAATFDDGFTANVFVYELMGINCDNPILVNKPWQFAKASVYCEYDEEYCYE